MYAEIGCCQLTTMCGFHYQNYYRLEFSNLHGTDFIVFSQHYLTLLLWFLVLTLPPYTSSCFYYYEACLILINVVRFAIMLILSILASSWAGLRRIEPLTRTSALQISFSKASLKKINNGAFSRLWLLLPVKGQRSSCFSILNIRICS